MYLLFLYYSFLLFVVWTADENCTTWLHQHPFSIYSRMLWFSKPYSYPKYLLYLYNLALECILLFCTIVPSSSLQELAIGSTYFGYTNNPSSYTVRFYVFHTFCLLPLLLLQLNVYIFLYYNLL